MVDALNPAITAATQWFERTLDDSANKRLSVAEGFLATDGILDLCINVTDGLKVYPKVIEKHIKAELPFMATENIMMDAVKAGGDRQVLHEIIREKSMEAGKNVKEEGLENNLLELLAAEPQFGLTKEEMESKLELDKQQMIESVEKCIDLFAAKAAEKNLDLVKIAPQAKPPVCKIIDYGKYRYEQVRKQKEARKKQKIVELKEVRLSPNIDANDMNTKVTAARKFLEKGNKVKATLRFRGREMAHMQASRHILEDFAGKVEDIAVIDKPIKQEGRTLTCVLSAKKN
jgi:translation initiation factor IF-3